MQKSKLTACHPEERSDVRIPSVLQKPQGILPLKNSAEFFRVRMTNGFTLIELMVVISVITILSTVGVASFVSYSRNQELTTAASELVTALHTAKSRALSQVKPDSCTGTLDGYKIAFCTLDPANPECSASDLNKAYVLYAVCDNTSITIETKNMPSNNITVDSTTAKSFLFRVLTGGVVITGGSGDFGTITINANEYGLDPRTITVYSDGRIVD